MSCGERSFRSAIFVPNFPAMRHIIILDDSRKRDRMMLDLARELRDIPVLTAEQWEAMVDGYDADISRETGTIPEWQKNLVRERMAEYKANPGIAIPWEDVKDSFDLDAK